MKNDKKMLSLSKETRAITTGHRISKGRRKDHPASSKGRRITMNFVNKTSQREGGKMAHEVQSVVVADTTTTPNQTTEEEETE